MDNLDRALVASSILIALAFLALLWAMRTKGPRPRRDFDDEETTRPFVRGRPA